MSLEVRETDDGAHLRFYFKCKRQKHRSVKKVIEVGKPKGLISVDIETDADGEFRRFTVTLKHSVAININDSTIYVSGTGTHVMDSLPAEVDEVKKIIFEKLEHTLSTACDRADQIQKTINMLENIATDTDCYFKITINKYDC